jgi:hypothetical protein
LLLGQLDKRGGQQYLDLGLLAARGGTLLTGANERFATGRYGDT